MWNIPFLQILLGIQWWTWWNCALNKISKIPTSLGVFENTNLSLCEKRKDLIRKIRLISNFMMSQPGKQTTAVHILPNILQSKGNHTMKLDQLIQHNMRKLFVEKSYTNVMEKSCSDSFLKNQNWAYFWTNILKFYTIYFYCISSSGYWIILKLSTLFDVIESFFKKWKEVWN